MLTADRTMVRISESVVTLIAQKIDVRQATLSDREAIFDFIAAAYQGREEFKIPHRWQWQFVDNPFRNAEVGNSEELPIWIAIDRERVIGQSCAMIEPLQTAGKECQVGWSVDTVVHSDYRGQGIGLRLQQANQYAHDIFMSVGMSAANARLKQRLGATVLAPLNVMQLRLNYAAENVFQRLRGFSPLAAGSAARTGIDRLGAIALSRSARRQWEARAQLHRNKLDALQLEQVDRFDESINGFSERVGNHYGLIVRRTAEYLNWKFVKQPHVRYAKWIARDEGELCGWLIARLCERPEPQFGVIADAFAMPGDDTTLAALLVQAVDYFRSHKVLSVRAATSVDNDRKVYESLGFKSFRKLIPQCHIKPVVCLADPVNVYLSHGDHDLDQFPRAR